MTYVVRPLQWTLVVISVQFINGTTPPGPPSHVTVVSDVNNIGVQWEPPIENYGNIRKYVVSWSVFPNFTEVTNIVSGDVTMCIISVKGQQGRLFRIRVQAENEGGIGPYSKPVYVRIACGEDFDILPGSNVTVTSPGYGTRDTLQPGLVCIWNFKALARYSLEFYFTHVEIVSPHSEICKDSYINVTGIGILCSLTNKYERKRQIKGADATLTLKAGFENLGKGFHITVKSIILLPGPPSNIDVKTSDHAILVSWQPPREETLPLTAYRIRYRVISGSGVREITLGHNMRQFAVNTDSFEGKLLTLNMTALIDEAEGEQSKAIFVRAPCRRHIHLSEFDSANITSPGYPRSYPRNIICTWFITSEHNVSIKYLDFRLEDTLFCSSDYISFSYKDNIEHECSTLDSSKTVQTDVRNFTLTFVTDNVNEYRGFLIEISSLGSQQVTSTEPSRQRTTVEYQQWQTTTSEIPAEHLRQTTSKNVTFTNTSISSITSGIPSRASTLFLETTSHTHNTYTEYTAGSGNVILQNSSKTISDSTTREANNLTVNAAASYLTTNDYFETETNNLSRRLPVASSAHAPSWTLPPPSGVGLFSAVTDVYNNSKATNNFSSSGKYPDISLDDEADLGISPIKFTVIVVTAIIVFLFLFCVTVCYFRWRHRHRTMKISARKQDGSHFTSVEMYDILNDTPQSSRRYTKNFRQISKESQLKVPSLETIHEHPEEHSGKPEEVVRMRRRHHSFPFCFSARNRKIHVLIERTLKTLDFIEDQTALRDNLERKHRIRRINSV